jgi:hypothetical protein
VKRYGGDGSCVALRKDSYEVWDGMGYRCYGAEVNEIKLIHVSRKTVVSGVS